MENVTAPSSGTEPKKVWVCTRGYAGEPEFHVVAVFTDEFKARQAAETYGWDVEDFDTDPDVYSDREDWRIR